MASRNASPFSRQYFFFVLFLGFVAVQFTEIDRCNVSAATSSSDTTNTTPSFGTTGDGKHSNGKNNDITRNPVATTSSPIPDHGMSMNDTTNTTTSFGTTGNGKHNNGNVNNTTQNSAASGSPIPNSDGSSKSLSCYQCASTVLDSPCYHDDTGLIETAEGKNKTYSKNCTDSNPRWDRCVIETHRGANNQYLLFRRDCHDGKTFNQIDNDKEFLDLNPNNFTTCNRVQNTLICFTFCQENFCNGPQPTLDDSDNNSGNSVLGNSNNLLLTKSCIPNTLLLFEFVLWGLMRIV